MANKKVEKVTLENGPTEMKLEKQAVKKVNKDKLMDTDWQNKYYEAMKKVEKWEDKYYDEMKRADKLEGKIRYCTFKMYLEGLKNRINLKDWKPIHRGKHCWYKSFKWGKNYYHFIKEFDKSQTYFYKEFIDPTTNILYILTYYIRKNGKLNFSTELRRDSGDRESC